jgi:hypothetical protein
MNSYEIENYYLLVSFDFNFSIPREIYQNKNKNKNNI